MQIPAIFGQALCGGLLPANGYGSVGVRGVGLQIAGIALDRFTVTGSPGIDTALFSAFTYNGAVAEAQ
jgi:hypothetical protein